jgi:hypothetical protein
MDVGGDTQRRLWKPHVLADPREQSFPMSILLACSTSRCKGTSQKVPMMSVLRQVTTRPSLQAYHDTTNLDVCLLWAQYAWPFTNYTRRIQQISGGYRQVYQVDHGQAGHLPQG